MHQGHLGVFGGVGAGLFNLSAAFKAVGEPAPTALLRMVQYLSLDARFMPETRFLYPKSRIPNSNLQSQIANLQSSIPERKSSIPNPKPQIAKSKISKCLNLITVQL